MADPTPRETAPTADTTSPLTVLARHDVRPGREEVFERWMSGITEACSDYEGYLGSELIRPVGRSGNEYVSIFRFDTYEHLETWIDSDERQRWLDRIPEFSDASPEVRYHQSLEFWFSPERNRGVAPTKYKMALVTFAVIWPMVHFIPRAVAEHSGLPRLAAEVVSVATIVLLMTYAVMPTVTRLLRPFLFDRR